MARGCIAAADLGSGRQQVTFRDLLLFFFFCCFFACLAPAGVILKNIPGNRQRTGVIRLAPRRQLVNTNLDEPLC